VYFEPGIVRGGLATYESIRSKKGNKWAAKIHRTRGLLETHFPNVNDGNAVLHFVKHAPFSMSRTLLEQMAMIWPTEYRVTADLKFRDYETVDIPTMHNMYCQVGCLPVSPAPAPAPAPTPAPPAQQVCTVKLSAVMGAYSQPW
jgi:hypothetical protein